MKTTDGRTISLLQGTYSKAGQVGDLILTDITLFDGSVITGPTVDKTTFKNLLKAQRLSKQFREADSKATRYTKEARYLAVNRGDFDKIDRLTARAESWERKRDAAYAGLAALGVF